MNIDKIAEIVKGNVIDGKVEFSLGYHDFIVNDSKTFTVPSNQFGDTEYDVLILAAVDKNGGKAKFAIIYTNAANITAARSGSLGARVFRYPDGRFMREHLLEIRSKDYSDDEVIETAVSDKHLYTRVINDSTTKAVMGDI